ncbi:FMN-dependent NADH-azoreductase [Actinoplanes sp. CA-252034]|uniref:FMN-dependent NADH-azoreductase n=1 Tax=Actinoplanes sp. CA-252034 TaxID=3239906 RepID=UPI003D9746CF
MATLLHLDSSIFPGGASSSRAVTDLFRRTWQEQHPEATVIYRDLNAHPVPHITAEAHSAAFTAAQDRTSEQSAALAARIRLIEELEQADAVLIGAPMYNYSIPSTLKAWLDNVIMVGRTAGTENSKLRGKPVTIAASRGGSYAPGTPRAGFEYVQSYLTAVLAETLGMRLDVIVAELTMAPINPAMAELVPLFEASRDQALNNAVVKAKAAVADLAA